MLTDSALTGIVKAGMDGGRGVTAKTAPLRSSGTSEPQHTLMLRSRTFILLTAFLSGIAVTAMEISASRIVAPFVGSSSIVWTNVIGVVLAALSVGYYLGGRLAERNPNLHILLSIMLATKPFHIGPDSSSFVLLAVPSAAT